MDNGFLEGNLEVQGVAYSFDHYDLSDVRWASDFGGNLLPLMESFDGSLMDFVNDKTIEHVGKLFTEKAEA